MVYSLYHSLHHCPFDKDSIASTAFANGVTLGDISRAATWASVNTFIGHYAINMGHIETLVALAVLKAAL